MSKRGVRAAALGGCVAVFVLAVVLYQGWLRSADGPADAPTAHWLLTPERVKGSDVAEAAGKLNGKLLGEPRLSTGKAPAALELRGGADGVLVRDKVPATADFLPKESLTVAAWVRLDEAGEWGGFLSLIQDNGPFEKGLLLGYHNRRLCFGLATQGGKDKLTYLEAPSDYEFGKWYHVAGTYDGKTMRLFVNAKEVATSTEQRGPVVWAPTAPLVLGRYRDDDEDYGMVGALREVLWLPRAWAPEDVAAHFEKDKDLAELPAARGEGYFVIEPYLQFPTRDSITVMWESSVPGNSVVEYGRAEPLDKKVALDESVSVHEVTLKGLQPETKYLYQVSTTDADGRVLKGKLLTFMTAVNPDSAWSFTVIGDTQKNPVVTGKIATLMWERRPHFVVHVGDVVDNGPDKGEWVNELFKPSAELLCRVPVFPAIGNHEKNHAHYYKYFSLPPPEYYYSYRYGNADFFVLDTNKKVGPDSEQYRWLEAELAKSDATWKIAYHHHPCYSSDDDDYGNTWKQTDTKLGDLNARSLVALYEKYNVDVVFNGHVHVYERTWPLRGGKVDRKNGVVYVTSGGGGGRLENFAPTPSWFKAECRVDYHFCYVTVQGGRFNLKAFDQQGRLFDYFEIEK